MPTYEYQCDKCEREFEVEQRITEDPLSDCECGGRGTLRRVIQPVGIVFNGPGFHVTDYPSGVQAKKDRGPKEEEPAPSSEAACSGDPDACPRCSDASDASA